MYKKRAVIILLVLSLVMLFNNNLKENITFHTADEIPSSCSIINERNVQESALILKKILVPKVGLAATLSAIDSLNPGDNGFLFKEELKNALKTRSGGIQLFQLAPKEYLVPNDVLKALYTVTMNIEWDSPLTTTGGFTYLEILFQLPDMTHFRGLIPKGNNLKIC